jgi:hypothetical protein
LSSSIPSASVAERLIDVVCVNWREHTRLRRNPRNGEQQSMTGFGIRRARQANATAAPSRGLITTAQMSRVPRPQGCTNKHWTAVEMTFK